MRLNRCLSATEFWSAKDTRRKVCAGCKRSHASSWVFKDLTHYESYLCNTCAGRRRRDLKPRSEEDQIWMPFLLKFIQPHVKPAACESCHKPSSRNLIAVPDAGPNGMYLCQKQYVHFKMSGGELCPKPVGDYHTGPPYEWSKWHQRINVAKGAVLHVQTYITTFTSSTCGVCAREAQHWNDHDELAPTRLKGQGSVAGRNQRT